MSVGVIWWEFFADEPGKLIGDQPKKQKSRKWYVDCNFSRTEIVRTAYLAAVQAEVHEAQEWFRYKNDQIYCPHIHVEALRSQASVVETG